MGKVKGQHWACARKKYVDRVENYLISSNLSEQKQR